MTCTMSGYHKRSWTVDDVLRKENIDSIVLVIKIWDEFVEIKVWFLVS